MRRLKVSIRTSAWLIALIAAVPTANADLVLSNGDSRVLKYDDSGNFLSVIATFPVVSNPSGVAFGPDGDLFVASSFINGQVLRFDGTTYAYEGVFASSDKPLRGLAFGTDGDLFVARTNFAGVGEVLRYDGVTGASEGVFATGSELSVPYDVTFGTGGDLFVTSNGTHEVLRYDGITGAFEGAFASGGGMGSPTGLKFGTDGDLFVSSIATQSVLRYDGVTGAFEGVFASGGLLGPFGLAFGPAGDLFVADGSSQSNIVRYDGVTGAYEGNFAVNGGLLHPTFLAFTPDDVSEAVPEPTSLALLGMGVMGLLAFLQRRTTHAKATIA